MLAYRMTGRRDRSLRQSTQSLRSVPEARARFDTPCSFSHTTVDVTLEGKSEAISTILGDLMVSGVSSHFVSSSASIDSTSSGWSFVPCQATQSSATSRTEAVAATDRPGDTPGTCEGLARGPQQVG